MGPGLTPGAAGPLAVAAGALLLLWPALLNGHPILARGSAEIPVPAWPWVAAQALAFSALAWILARLTARATPRRHLLLCAGLAVATPAAWVASLAATDALVAAAALAGALAAWGWPRLGAAERAALPVLAAGAAILAPLAGVALLAVALVALALRDARAALRAALPAMIALLVAGAAPMPLTAEGAVTRTLDALCPARGWDACTDPSRPAPGEAPAILAATLAREPAALLLEAAARAARQFVTAGIGDTLGRPDPSLATTDATPQARGELRRIAASVAWLHQPILVVATAFLLLAVLRARLRGDALRLGLGAGLLAAAGANALVTGALLGVEPRHQASLAWLLPLAALLLRLPPRPGRPVEGYATENTPRGEVATQDLAPDPRADLSARPKPRG